MTDIILSKHQLKLKHETMAYTEDRRDWSITLKARSESGVVRISFRAAILNKHLKKYRTCGGYLKNNPQAISFVTRIFQGISEEHILIDRYRATFHHYGLLEHSHICPLDRGALKYSNTRPVRQCYEFPKHCGFTIDRKAKDLVTKLVMLGDLVLTLDMLTDLARILEFETDGKFPRPYDG
jgi:hypothetical protein